MFPTSIVGRRTRVHLDGNKVDKIYLDPKEKKEVDFKLPTFKALYKKLTNKVGSY